MVAVGKFHSQRPSGVARADKHDVFHAVGMGDVADAPLRRPEQPVGEPDGHGADEAEQKPTTMLERGIRLPSKWNTSTPITPSTTYAPVMRNTSGVLTKAQMELYSRKIQNTRSVITHHRPMADRKPSRWTGRISAKENHTGTTAPERRRRQ